MFQKMKNLITIIPINKMYFCTQFYEYEQRF